MINRLNDKPRRNKYGKLLGLLASMAAGGIIGFGLYKLPVIPPNIRDLPTIFAILSSYVQVAALILIVYELAVQIELRRKPIIRIKVATGTRYYYQIDEDPNKLDTSISDIGDDGRISIVLFNIGRANLNGMKVLIHAEKDGRRLGIDRFRPPPTHRHVDDMADEHVWETTSLLVRLVAHERLPIIMHIIPQQMEPDTITVVVHVIADNLDAPITEKLDVSYPARLWPKFA